MVRCGVEHSHVECCPFPSRALSVEAVVTVDERGQILIPKNVREKIKLKAGSKLALLVHLTEEGGELCYLMLIPTERIVENIEKFLGPLFKELMRE